ncbi:3-dehydroquinate synthase [Snuella sedimenti]|uniref:3-dehydroquinate synthase n=1 Tax=Snuella sedimenti TaxID=2798802 RepID=A0A8J7LMF8_9FLAO|nr:3-dehydroquinate synthase [Snuella sedimenti]MBJ6366658.1 3-dehydroquinate synthase [Snuella sedimenti]
MNKTTIIRQSIQVNFNFNLIFTSHLFKVDNPILVDLFTSNTHAKSNAIVVVDDGVTKAHPQLKASIANYFETHGTSIKLQGNILEIPGGEQAKNNEAYIKTILESVNNFGIDRHSYVIAIGGGAVLDAVGFAAAIAHRGVRLIRVPTTILSQNDSGIGVKNGINYFGKKNFVGTFSAPYAVINDDSFLSSLDDRDWRSGISEAIKVALIKDRVFFEWIETNATALNNRDQQVMNTLIHRCAEMHMQHIQNSGDAFEQGSSRPLDFGHWAAHKLEQLSNYSIRHGEAVAIGIALDSTYSYLKGYLTANSLTRILNCILNLGFSLSHDHLNAHIIDGLNEFREHLGGKLTIMLLKSLGTGFEVHEMDEAIVLKSITYMNDYIQT